MTIYLSLNNELEVLQWGSGLEFGLGLVMVVLLSHPKTPKMCALSNIKFYGAICCAVKQIYKILKTQISLTDKQLKIDLYIEKQF